MSIVDHSDKTQKIRERAKDVAVAAAKDTLAQHEWTIETEELVDAALYVVATHGECTRGFVVVPILSAATADDFSLMPLDLDRIEVEFRLTATRRPDKWVTLKVHQDLNGNVIPSVPSLVDLTKP